MLNCFINKNVMRKLVSAFVCVSFVLSSWSWASFEKAMEVYSSGDFVQAKAAFETLAAIGDRSSLFNLGVMHYRGEIGERDPVTAYVLMSIANEGFDDTSFAKTAAAIYKKFTSEQKKEVDKVYAKLVPIYGIKNIRENIFPKPLDDEDCASEVRAVKKVTPSYPKTELAAGKFGLTRVEYTISPEGYPRDVIVFETSSSVFTASTIRALKGYLYNPPADNQPIYNHRMNFIYVIGRDGGDVEVNSKVLLSRLKTLEVSAVEGDVIAQYRYASNLNVFRHFKSYLTDLDLQYRTANEWFAKSAAGGLPHAQFEVGRNMIEGRGCEIDKENGYKWINAAAIGGYSPAQQRLAQLSLSDEEQSRQKSLAVISWLRNASLSGHYGAKLLLAWELSTSSEPDFRNGEEALALIKADNDNYFDDLRVLETKAAAYAEIGNFKKAVKYQKKAAKTAKKLKWHIPIIGERLALYEQKKPYQGEYY